MTVRPTARRPRDDVTRLFVAAWPDAATLEQLRALPWPDEPGVRRIPDHNLHVTLRFLGEVDPATASELLAAAALPVATAGVGPEVERLDGRQIVVPVGGVDHLAAAIRSATASIGDEATRRFRGHLTIARTKRGEASALVGATIIASFAVGEVALVASDLQPTGAVYTTLATFPVALPHQSRPA